MTFLTDGSMGPFTGGSIRFADLDAEEEIYKFPREDHRVKLLYGAAVRHFLEGEYDRFWAIINDPRNPITPEAKEHIELAIERDDDGQHRYEIMLYGWERLQEYEHTLEQRLRDVNANLARPMHTLSADRLAERTQKLEYFKYGHLRELLGINLAQGDMKMVASYIDQLKDFPMEQYEEKGHTRAMIGYLESGGFETLERKARFGTKYWRSDKIGTIARPGSWRLLYRDCKKEARATAIVAAASLPVSMGLTYAGFKYRAEIASAFQGMGLDPQIILQYFK